MKEWEGFYIVYMWVSKGRIAFPAVSSQSSRCINKTAGDNSRAAAEVGLLGSRLIRYILLTATTEHKFWLIKVHSTASFNYRRLLLSQSIFIPSQNPDFIHVTAINTASLIFNQFQRNLRHIWILNILDRTEGTWHIDDFLSCSGVLVGCFLHSIGNK